MKTEKEQCVGCNKCIFGCPTHANNAVLDGNENKIYVDESLCIQCGACLEMCDHNARFVEDDTALFFKDLEAGKRISIIAAPSIKYNIPEYERLFAFLQSKGVTVFYDVSLGADITTWGYIKAAKERNITSMISAPCPVVVDYIENFIPSLIPSLSPVHSPALCVAIYMKKYMDITEDIAFLSPCFGKKNEFNDKNTNGYVKYNVTYKNILEYIEQNNIDLAKYEKKSFDNIKGGIGLTFSRPGGLAENVSFYLGDDTWIYQIEGIKHIKEYLSEYEKRIESGKPVPFLVDALNCENGCNLGTATLKNIAVDDINYKTDRLKKEVEKENAKKLFLHFDSTLNFDDFIRVYENKSHITVRAASDEVERVFNSLEKYTELERRINCFSCGFGNCYDFANAVALGKNHSENCFRYTYKKITEQTEELIVQGQSLYEQRQLLEAKNEELTQAINYAKQVEESLKVEREINEFAVATKYDLVSLLDVKTRTLTVYKKSEIFEKGGLTSGGDYDTTAELVLSNLIHEDDRENFRRLFFDNLINELNLNDKFIIEYRLLDVETQNYSWKRVIYRYFHNSKDVIIQLTEDINVDKLIQRELEVKNEKLILNEKCFKALSEHTNKVVLEWDFEKNKITAMSNFRALFGRKATTINDAADALSVKAVHEEDKESFTEVFQTIRAGNPVEDARFRIADSDGVYHWCSLSGLVIKDNQGKPFKAIGSLENIEVQLNKEAELRQKAETDQLTGLYNKAATEHLIKDVLVDNQLKSRRYALMVIDVDNFKNVNDNLGHLYGDMVLAELSEELRPLFRTNDIVGRVGGDEFFVMLVDFNDEKLLEKKAKAICNTFRKTYSSGQNSVKISASVGISVFPEHGDNYETLFRNADLALYDTKSKGKDGFTFYSGQEVISYNASRTEIDSHGSVQKSFKENRMEYIFKLLYESDNENGNIESTLQFITERYRFSRGYIFEMDSSGMYINNTFEWCAHNISPEIDNMQNLSMGVPQIAITSFKEHGVFIVEDVKNLPPEERGFLEKQDIKSMLQFGIMEKGEPIGFIGFDDCIRERVLAKDELEELKLICHVLATFLIKQRVTELAQSNYDSMLSIFHNFEGYAYVVDRDNYEVLFENENVKKIVGASSIGKCCYKQYMHKDSPCEVCPIGGLSDAKAHNTVEIDNVDYGIYSRTTASKIDWIDGKQNYLISSVDVTEYKI